MEREGKLNSQRNNNEISQYFHNFLGINDKSKYFFINYSFYFYFVICNKFQRLNKLLNFYNALLK